MSHLWLRRAETLGRWLENILLCAFFASILLLSGVQILLRNGFSSGLPWADGLIRVLVLWLAVVGAIAASRDHKHIAIELIARALPGVLGKIAASVVSLFTSAVAGYFAWQAFRFVKDSHDFGDLLVNDWPAWILQLILPIGFGLIAYRYLVIAASSFWGDD